MRAWPRGERQQHAGARTPSRKRRAAARPRPSVEYPPHGERGGGRRDSLAASRSKVLTDRTKATASSLSFYVANVREAARHDVAVSGGAGNVPGSRDVSLNEGHAAEDPTRPGFVSSRDSSAPVATPPETDLGGARWGTRASKFRAAVLARAGGRCQAVVDGAGCTATARLEAHHVAPTTRRPRRVGRPGA